jgi:hypothetical protein
MLGNLNLCRLGLCRGELEREKQHHSCKAHAHLHACPVVDPIFAAKLAATTQAGAIEKER